jgi:allophanate hydrolase subunit 2
VKVMFGKTFWEIYKSTNRVTYYLKGEKKKIEHCQN